MKTVSIIVPVYFNEGSLPSLFVELLKIEAELNSRNLALQLIFVDDGSKDSSLAELLKIKAQRPATTVVKLARNFGAVNASKTGMRYVTGDCFMLLAADLQDPPEVIIQMAEHWQAGHPYVIAVRAGRDDPFLSQVYAAIYYRLLRMLVVAGYPQAGFDMFMLDAKALPHLRDSAKHMNPSLLSYWLGFPPKIITYTRRKREHGKSRWTFIKRLQFMLDSLLGFSVLPLRLITFIGVVVALMSMGYGFLVVINAMVGNRDVPGFPTMVALITFLLGLIIVMLGIIGEYLWRIFDELNKRPEVVIDEVY